MHVMQLCMNHNTFISSGFQPGSRLRAQLCSRRRQRGCGSTLRAKVNITCACRKAIGSAQGHGSDQWLPGILSTVPQAYTRTHFSAYLYLASHVVRSCGTENSPHRIAVAQAATPMIQEACGRLASLAACNQSPHDADDLFLMAYKGLSHAPSLFLDRGLLEGLLRVAAVGLLVQHQDAFRSIQSFLFRLLDVQTLSCAPDQQASQVMLQVCFSATVCYVRLQPCSRTQRWQLPPVRCRVQFTLHSF